MLLIFLFKGITGWSEPVIYEKYSLWRVLYDVDANAVRVFDGEMPVAPGLIPYINFYGDVFLFQLRVDFVYILHFYGKVHALSLEGLMKKWLLAGMFRKQEAYFSTVVWCMKQEVKFILKGYPEPEMVHIESFAFCQFVGNNACVQFHGMFLLYGGILLCIACCSDTNGKQAQKFLFHFAQIDATKFRYLSSPEL